ncbi:putative serine/threonine-protein kinase TBK1 isoform X2 [Apostichopus japonicus]|uniref:Putative serine/threonine-protein kinase TBK1 isoform X2 n=1 Tax=Stichopus japonicus TaxID=307972 RepID=A0A2G8JD10_STIJA|nr:putative serine/threonine-protein kinase TBK1 isoform X2 [Apostichopus japonicus]
MQGKNPIRSSKSFIWYTKDVLGTGATSTVFQGRFKKNGDQVAVKVFNNLSFMRPSSVQQREFEVLLKLKHQNVVKLIAIEEDVSKLNRLPWKDISYPFLFFFGRPSD